MKLQHGKRGVVQMFGRGGVIPIGFAPAAAFTSGAFGGIVVWSNTLKGVFWLLLQFEM